MRRQRAGERDALLLAAGKLGRIVVDPVAQADRGELLRGALERVRRCRRVRAAPRRSPAPSWSGSGGTTGTRCRHGGRGSARARPRRAGRGPRPATNTAPVSGRSSPAATISRVDLPEPEGPTRPTASPVPICRSMSLRIWTRAAPRPSDRLTPESRIAGGCSHRGVVHAVFRSTRPGESHRSYGKPGRPVQRSGWVIMALACFGIVAAMLTGRARPSGRSRIVVLGDSLTAGFGLAAPDALPAKLERALKAQGPRGHDRECRRFRRYRGGRPGAARLVGRRRDRRGDPRARRQ